MHSGDGGQRERDGAAQAQNADVGVAAHHHPAGARGKGADPQRRADGIDHQQNEDDAEAANRGAGKIGRVEPSATVWQASQQQCDAHAAFAERDHEGQCRERERRGHIVPGDHQRHAEKNDHGSDATHRESRRVARELRLHPFGA